MAIAKVILNNEVLMDVTSNTNITTNMLNGVVGTKNDGTSVTGNIATKSVANLYTSTTSDWINVVTPAGYYSTNASFGFPLRSELTQGGANIIAQAGYYSENIVYTVNTGSAFPPAVTITKNPTFSMNSSTGVVTASYTGSSSITPTVNAGYISQGTAGTVSTTGTSTFALTSKAADTYYPSTADQTISSYRWLTGNQTIKSVVTSNLTADNIAEGVVVKIGDTTNDSRIAQITGTHAGGTTDAYSVDEIAMRTFRGILSGNTTTIVNYGFYYWNVTGASFPNATFVGGHSFEICYSLTSAYFPQLSNIQPYCFAQCERLSSVHMPLVTIVYSYGFQSCYSLNNPSFPLLSSIGSYAFGNCRNLETLSLPSASTINSYAFRSCYMLKSLYLLGSSVASLLAVNAFSSTPISNYTTSTGGVYGSIFVPSSLYNTYITATNWTTYSSRIVSM